MLGVGVVLCNAGCISLARPVPLLPLLPLQPPPVLVPVPAACTVPSHLALALLPHLAQLQLQLQLQIPSIAHEHAAALLPHPVSIYLSLPCLPRLNRLAPHAASTLVLVLVLIHILTPSTPIPFLSSPFAFVPVFPSAPSCPLLASETTSPSYDWPPSPRAMPSTCV